MIGVQLGEWLQRAAARLKASGIESAALEARRLAEGSLALRPADLVLLAARELARSEQEALDRLVIGREHHIPLQYLLGRAAFRSLDLAVGPGVFIPRPETEALVDLALPLLRAVARFRRPRVLELCLGSGAVLAAILGECPAALGWGVELSATAVDYARRNFRAAGVAGRARILEGDLFAPLAAAGLPEHSFDLIVANPPYIPEPAIAGLAEEVRCHEPVLALDGGPDGLSVITRIVNQARPWLGPGGRMLLEIDASHGESVVARLDRRGWAGAQVQDDAAGRPRYASAWSRS